MLNITDIEKQIRELTCRECANGTPLYDAKHHHGRSAASVFPCTYNPELLSLFNAGIAGAYAASAKVLDELADLQDALSENASKREQIEKEQECAEICEHLREAAISIRALTPADAREISQDKVLTLEAKLKAIGEVLERDRTIVAELTSRIRDAVKSRDWLMEGRGPYEWDDDRWHSEFAAAAEEILTSLEPMQKIAGNLEDCPQKWQDIVNARMSQTTYNIPTKANYEMPPVGQEAKCIVCGYEKRWAIFLVCCGHAICWDCRAAGNPDIKFDPPVDRNRCKHGVWIADYCYACADEEVGGES